MAILTRVRNEFEAWSGVEVDGPMPRVATPELSRAKFQVRHNEEVKNIIIYIIII